MATEGFKRELASILGADAVGYSRLMGDDEAATVRTLTSYRKAIADLVSKIPGSHRWIFQEITYLLNYQALLMP